MVRRQAALGAAAVLLYANNADAFMGTPTLSAEGWQTSFHV